MEKLTPIKIEHEKGRGFIVMCASSGCNTILYTADKDGSTERSHATVKIFEHVGSNPLDHDIQILNKSDNSTR